MPRSGAAVPRHGRAVSASALRQLRARLLGPGMRTPAPRRRGRAGPPDRDDHRPWRRGLADAQRDQAVDARSATRSSSATSGAGFRPDRVAMWAVLLGIMLLLSRPRARTPRLLAVAPRGCGAALIACRRGDAAENDRRATRRARRHPAVCRPCAVMRRAVSSPDTYKPADPAVRLATRLDERLAATEACAGAIPRYTYERKQMSKIKGRVSKRSAVP